MANNILVAYATEYGSTQEVAEAVVSTLRAEGIEVELHHVREVRSLEGYRAVVLGAPLYMFRWHRDARNFLSRHRKALQSLPVYVFALGPFHNKEEELQSVHEQMGKELARYPWFKPLVVQPFVGKFDPAKLRFPFNIIGPLKNMPACDERDWPAIKTWASDLADRFHGGSAVPLDR